MRGMGSSLNKELTEYVQEMYRKDDKRERLFWWSGMTLSITVALVYFLVPDRPSEVSSVMFVVAILSLILMGFCLGYIAKRRGYSQLWGTLVCLGLIGFIIVMLLPIKKKAKFLNTVAALPNTPSNPSD